MDEHRAFGRARRAAHRRHGAEGVTRIVRRADARDPDPLNVQSTMMTFSTVRNAGVRSACALLASFALTLPASAQQPVPTDTMYLHAHGLVSRGQGAEGRALV